MSLPGLPGISIPARRALSLDLSILLRISAQGTETVKHSKLSAEHANAQGAEQEQFDVHALRAAGPEMRSPSEQKAISNSRFANPRCRTRSMDRGCMTSLRKNARIAGLPYILPCPSSTKPTARRPCPACSSACITTMLWRSKFVAGCGCFHSDFLFTGRASRLAFSASGWCSPVSATDPLELYTHADQVSKYIQPLLPGACDNAVAPLRRGERELGGKEILIMRRVYIRSIRPADSPLWEMMRRDLWPDGAEDHGPEIALFLAAITSQIFLPF